MVDMARQARAPDITRLRTVAGLRALNQTMVQHMFSRREPQRFYAGAHAPPVTRLTTN